MRFTLLIEKGFSIVQGMILSGVLAGSALVATKMLSEQKKVQKSAESRDQIEDLHRVVYSALQNRKNCETTIFAQSGTSAETQIIQAGSIVPINQIYSENPVDINSPITVVKKFTAANDISQLYMNGNVIVKDIFIHSHDSSSGTSTLSILYERMAGRSGTNAQFKRTKDGFGAKEIRKNITLRIQRDPFSSLNPKPFESCYATTEDSITGAEDGNKNLSRQLCEEMNGNKDITDGDILKDGSGSALAGQRMWIWDEATATCLPNAKCPNNQVYTGVDSTGDVKCRTIKEWGDFQNMLAPTEGTCLPGQTARLEIIKNNDPVRVRIKCSSSPGGGCASQPLNWSNGANNCAGSAPSGMPGQIVTIPSSNGTPGNLTLHCNISGGWTKGASTCSVGCLPVPSCPNYPNLNLLSSNPLILASPPPYTIWWETGSPGYCQAYVRNDISCNEFNYCRYSIPYGGCPANQ